MRRRHAAVVAKRGAWERKALAAGVPDAARARKARAFSCIAAGLPIGRKCGSSSRVIRICSGGRSGHGSWRSSASGAIALGQ